jgi:hypothetical protein
MAIYDFGLSVSAFGGLFGLVIPDIFVIYRQWPLSFSLSTSCTLSAGTEPETGGTLMGMDDEILGRTCADILLRSCLSGP